MPSDQISFTVLEYANRRRVSRRKQFLETMDATIPWSRWVGMIEPSTYSGRRGRRPKALETMLRMYLLQAWFSLSDEGVEDVIYDSYAMRRFLGRPSCAALRRHRPRFVAESDTDEVCSQPDVRSRGTRRSKSGCSV